MRIDREGAYSRRAVIAAGLAAAFNKNKVGAQEASEFFPEQDTKTRINAPDLGLTQPNFPYEELEISYAQQLFRELQEPSVASPDEKAATIANNLVGIISLIPADEDSGMGGDLMIVPVGNALRIDKSGLFLTSDKFIRDLSGFVVENWIFDPYTRTIYLAQNCLHTPESHASIIHAPTSQARKRVDNLQFVDHRNIRGYMPLWANEIGFDGRPAPFGDFTLRRDAGGKGSLGIDLMNNSASTEIENISAEWWYDGAPIINPMGNILGVLNRLGDADSPAVMRGLGEFQYLLENGQAVRLPSNS